MDSRRYECSRIHDLLPDYSVRAVDGRTMRAVENHLRGCPACRRELGRLEEVVALVERHGSRLPPPGLYHGVLNRIEAGDFVRERPAWWSWLSTRPARAAAMGLAMASVALGLFLPAGPSQFPDVPVHPHSRAGSGVTTSALAGSIRQHAMSAAEGPLTDRVAWEAMAQLASQERAGQPAP